MIEDSSLAKDSLLPSGFSDILFPDCADLRKQMTQLLEEFEGCGYGYVSAPLLEFEENYLKGSGDSLRDQCFRIMDPQSKKMMILRPDMTPQVARIASTRLKQEARPLRLCYSGTCVTVLPVSAEETRRQIAQTGIELIGPDTPKADIEVLKINAKALKKLGIDDFSFDLTIPSFVPTLLQEMSVSEEDSAYLMEALVHKDMSAVQAWGKEGCALWLSLLEASGEAKRALKILDGLSLPKASAKLYSRFKQTVLLLQEECPDLSVTVDLAEVRGWRYHTGVCVTIFSDNTAQELGRGGRYRCQNGEPAFGLTLRPDVLFHILHDAS